MFFKSTSSIQYGGTELVQVFKMIPIGKYIFSLEGKNSGNSFTIETDYLGTSTL